MPRRSYKLIGVPLNYGANKCGIEYGMDNFLKKFPKYKENLEVIEVEKQEEDFSEKGLKFLNTIRVACSKLAEKTAKVVENEELPISVGGDHAIAIGSIAGVSAKKSVGVLWVDAHGDFNTKDTTESGHIHGMPLAASCGYGSKELVDCLYEGRKVLTSDVVLFGIRSLDKKEEELINKAGVRCYKYSEIEERGFDLCLKEATDQLKKSGKDIHISFDLDSIDPMEVSGVSTPVKKGLSKAEGIKLIDYVFDNHSVSSVDIVEYNPIFEKGNDTVEYMNELIERIIER